MSDKKITLGKASLIAGIGYILMFGTAISEFTVMNRLVDLKNAELTFNNIAGNLDTGQNRPGTGRLLPADATP